MSNSSETKSIIITRCLVLPCPGTYTDSIFESVRIICKSPRHINKEINENEKTKVTPGSKSEDLNFRESEYH